MEKLTEDGTPNSGTGSSQAGPVQGEPAAGGARPAVTGGRMLFRHPVHRMLGGVCGGLADLFGWDPTLVRILWVVATLATGGGGILAYLALWILLPVGTAAGGQQRPPAIELNERNLSRAAFLLIGLGALWLLANLGILPMLWGGLWRVVGVVFWPAVLIGAGYLLLRYTGRGEWSFDWASTRNRVKGEVNGRMPSKEDVKQGLRQAREHFPLKRSRSDRIFMGVCGGIGQRLGIDANLVRLVWAAFSVGSIGMGVLIYVLLGLFLPEEPATGVRPFVDDGQDIQVIDVTTTRV
jgi:phage shock protein C